MMDRKLTCDDFGNTRGRLGFARGYTAGDHQVLKHDPSDTIILLPPRYLGMAVDAIHFIAVRRMAAERGAVDETVYDKALEDMKFAVLSEA